MQYDHFSAYTKATENWKEKQTEKQEEIENCNTEMEMKPISSPG